MLLFQLSDICDINHGKKKWIREHNNNLMILVSCEQNLALVLQLIRKATFAVEKCFKIGSCCKL